MSRWWRWLSPGRWNNSCITWLELTTQWPHHWSLQASRNDNTLPLSGQPHFHCVRRPSWHHVSALHYASITYTHVHQRRRQRLKSGKMHCGLYQLQEWHSFCRVCHTWHMGSDVITQKLLQSDHRHYLLHHATCPNFKAKALCYRYT